jgi:chloramphenicol O-acetyltransferase
LYNVLQKHPSFCIRYAPTYQDELFDQNDWYLFENLPVVIPVALGNQQRFTEVLIDDIGVKDYEEFIHEYIWLINYARKNECYQRPTGEEFSYAHVFGNLPHLRFTGLKLPCTRGFVEGHPWFYFGQRYYVGNKLHIPFHAKLHHSTQDPFVLSTLLKDFQDYSV